MNDESYVDSDEIEEMPDGTEIDLLEVLENIQRQLTFLEKKVDMLLSRSEGERPFKADRPFNGARPQGPRPPRKPYDKPFQRFDRPPRRDRNDGEGRERSYGDKESSRDHYSERRKGGGGRKPGGKPRSNFGKKPFHSRYSD